MFASPLPLPRLARPILTGNPPVHAAVATFDGTDASLTSYSYPCPDVSTSPPSPLSRLRSASPQKIVMLMDGSHCARARTYVRTPRTE